MNARIGRLWQRRSAERDLTSGQAAISDPDETPEAPLAAIAREAPLSPDLALATSTDVGAPEQPVLLPPADGARQLHIGDVLPPVRRGWPRSLARLPAIPKRAILAAGVCAGLVGPALARHLALRLLLGPAAGRVGAPAAGTFEITRIIYHGPLTVEAMSTIYKTLTAGRR
jgi:hypothetical protein